MLLALAFVATFASGFFCGIAYTALRTLIDNIAKYP